jgi:glycosyltransferase involved in cell wall biosynthesis
MARVHVLHVIARLNDGGPARVIASLARALPQVRQSVVHGACGDDERDASALVRDAGAALWSEPCLGRRLSPLADARALAAVAGRIRALDPSVVHTHTAKAGALGRVVCALSGRPCLHTYHGHVLHGYAGPLASALAGAAERALGSLGWNHALTQGQLEELHRHHRIGRRQRWRVLPPPVAPIIPVARGASAWHAGLVPGRAVLLFLGRLVAVKDPLLWLEVLGQIDRQFPVQGLMCGDGPDRQLIAQAAARAGVPVLLTGTVPAAEALGAADLLLMTSRNEGLPLAAVEAAGAGVPVVAPAVGGLADLIGWGGAEGAHRHPAALSQACVRMLCDRVARERRIAAARVVAERLDPRALAPAYARLYDEVAASA